MAYLGCVFTQHQCDAKGHPIRDHDSTTSTGWDLGCCTTSEPVTLTANRDG